MTYNEKLEFLRGYKVAKENAETYMRQIDDLRDTMLPSGIHISDMPKHPNYEDAMADYAGKFWEIQRRLERAQAQQLRVVAVINQIADDDPLGHRILTERYIKGNKRDYICRILYISGDTEWRHRRRAIERLKI